jgi:diguanylate cyclase (GGDEF)-like protein
VVPAAAGLLSLPLLRQREASRWWGGLDAVVIASSALFVSWATVMGPAITAHSGSPLVRVSTAAYPVVDVLLASLVLSLATRAPARDRWQWLLLGSGITMMALTNHVYAINAETYVPGTLLDLGWAIAFALLALAALAPDAGEVLRPAQEHRLRVVRQAVPYVPAAVALVTAAAMDVTGDPVLRLIGVTALALFLFRQFALLAENARLTGDLSTLVRSRTSELELLRAVASTSNSADSIHDAMHRTLRAVCDYTGWQVGHAYIILESTAELRDTHVWCVDNGDDYAPLRKATEDIRFAEGVGLPGQVVETGRPVWPGQLAEADDLPRQAVFAQCGIHGAFGFPVFAGEALVAVLEFFATRPVPRDPALLNVMADIGTQLGRVVERHRNGQRLRHQATHDPLTDLPNRELFRERVEYALSRLSRRQGAVGVLLIDLDGFKDINDSLGHSVGDDLLREIGRRLRTVARPLDTVARLGGDEFAIILEDEGDGGAAEHVAGAVLDVLPEPLTLAGRSLSVTASVGVALVAPGSGDGVGEMLRNADLAMYRAKKAGKGRAVFFEPDWHAESVARLEFEADLRHSVERQDFELHYQPISDLATGRIVGTEALVRWFHHGRGSVPPTEFIPVAEETGLIRPLGAWVLDEAVRQTREWQRSSPDYAEMTVAVNVSVEQLHPDFVAELAAILERHAFQASCLTLEITESVVAEEETAMTHVLHEVSGLGVKVAVDDFGTGYSALHRLRQFPFDELKIDRSFVHQLGDRAADPLVTAMIALGHGLGLRVVAEGIETPHQLRFLAEHRCDHGQGYLVSRPLPPERLYEVLHDPVPAWPGGLEVLPSQQPLDRLDAELLDLIGRGMRGDVEIDGLVRPILTKLEEITGLESTYVTQIHWDAGTQSIRIARNVGTLTIPEDAVVAWPDTLCQYAVNDSLTTVDAQTRFPMSGAAAALDIRSYTGVPIHTGDGGVYGTLCGASTERVPQPPENIALMELFARVIGHVLSAEPATQHGA